MKRIPLIALPLFCLYCVPVSGSTVFVDGVTENSGWFDVNKTFDDQDDDLCWAAAVSNVIHWWQDRQPSIPAGTPTGAATDRYSSDIFGTFVQSFSPSDEETGYDAGGEEYDGFNWWLTGYYDPESYLMKAGASPAGFWKDVYPDAAVFYQRLDLNSIYTLGGNTKNAFTSGMIMNVDLGCAMTFGIYTTGAGGHDDGGAHAVTLWGYEKDDLSGDIVSIFMTDSDDVIEGGDPIAETNLKKVGLDYRDNKVFLTNDYDNWYIGDVGFYSAIAVIPESSTVTLALGSLLLGVFRRRRS